MSEAETAAPNPNTETTVPEKREFVIKRPGSINWSDGKSNYPGSKLIRFEDDPFGKEGGKIADEKVNEFYKENANVIEMWKVPVVLPDGRARIHLMYTNFLEGEELEEFNEYSRSVSEHMRLWRQQRAEHAAKQEQREDEAKKEMTRLLEVAKKCEANHAAVIEDNAQMKKELKKLRKGK